MIIITGFNRSGTSLVAGLYQRLGLDPGGSWFPDSRSGLEDEEIVRANAHIIGDLGMLRTGRVHTNAFKVRFEDSPVVTLDRTVKRAAKGVLPPSMHDGARRAWTRLRRVNRRVNRARMAFHRRYDLIRWERFDDVVARHGPALRRLAAGRTVVKDPRFSFTLGVWAAAGVPIEHVLVCVRSLDASVESLVQAGYMHRSLRRSGKNWFAYGLGLCLVAIHDHRLSHTVLRFPDFLARPGELYEAMRIPSISPERFREVFQSEVREDFVHDRR